MMSEIDLGGRGKFPDHIGFKAPRELRAIATEIADTQGRSLAEVLRHALGVGLSECENEYVLHRTDGDSTKFSVPFRFELSSQGVNLTVHAIIGGHAVGLTLGGTYTVHGAGAPEGGFVETRFVPPAGWTLLIRRTASFQMLSLK
jgi:hypothetical protein